MTKGIKTTVIGINLVIMSSGILNIVWAFNETLTKPQAYLSGIIGIIVAYSSMKCVSVAIATPTSPGVS